MLFIKYPRRRPSRSHPSLRSSERVSEPPCPDVARRVRRMFGVTGSEYRARSRRQPMGSSAFAPPTTDSQDSRSTAAANRSPHGPGGASLALPVVLARPVRPSDRRPASARHTDSRHRVRPNSVRSRRKRGRTTASTPGLTFPRSNWKPPERRLRRSHRRRHHRVDTGTGRPIRSRRELASPRAREQVGRCRGHIQGYLREAARSFASSPGSSRSMRWRTACCRTGWARAGNEHHAPHARGVAGVRRPVSPLLRNGACGAHFGTGRISRSRRSIAPVRTSSSPQAAKGVSCVRELGLPEAYGNLASHYLVVATR